VCIFLMILTCVKAPNNNSGVCYAFAAREWSVCGYIGIHF
jgi:hypothetical protein